MVESNDSFDSTTYIPVPQTTMASSSKDDNNVIIYLNNAGSAWLDPQVRALGQSILDLPPFDMHGETDQAKIRQLYATLIDNHASNIAIMPSTAFAITLVARNVQRTHHQHFLSSFSDAAGDNKTTTINNKNKIVLLQDQFCSAVYPWQEICEESISHNSNNNHHNLSLKIVPYPKDKQGGWTEAILEHLTDDVLCTCLPPLHWSDGALVGLKQIGVVCRQKNIMLIVDATQAVGILPCTVESCGNPIVMACSVHKWLRGPTGASLVYMDPKLYDIWQPLDQHGRSRDTADGPAWDASKDEMGPNGYPEKYFKDARKFDSGGKPNPILLPMLRLGMEQAIERVDLTTVQDHLKKLMTPLLEWALANGFTMTPGKHCYHLIGIRPTFLTVEEMLAFNAKLEKEHKVYIAVRCGAFRIAPYLDTTPDEIQRFIAILKQMCLKACIR